MIVMSGVIGAGKSSLSKILADEFDMVPYFEPVKDNPILPMYYKNPEKYAFLLQIYFLNARFKMVKEAMQDEKEAILDRSIYEDAIFFHLNADMGRATKQEVAVYDDLLDNMLEELPYASHKKSPDLLIYIKVSLPTMLAHIKERGRSYEQIDTNPELLNYYKRLLEAYDKWFEGYNESPKVMIDGDKLDFVNVEQDRKSVLQSVIQNKTPLNRFLHKLSKAGY